MIKPISETKTGEIFFSALLLRLKILGSDYFPRFYRWSIYLLLAIVIGSGFTLSVVLDQSVENIRHAVKMDKLTSDFGSAYFSPEARSGINHALDFVKNRINRAEEQYTETDNHPTTIADELDLIATLVHAFNILALLTTIFLAYHISARFRSEDELAHRTNYDPLTGLAHRRAFEKRLRVLRKKQHVVVLGTVDRFERVISGYGHDVSDNLLKSVAERIHGVALSHGGEVFRLDGANLAILFEMQVKDALFSAALSAMRANMKIPFFCEGHEIFSSLSLGVAEYPKDGDSPASLLKNVGAALQAARKSGNGMLVTYSNVLNATSEKRLELEVQLQHALERHEFEVYYQPQLALDNDALIGFEALIRWKHNGNLISPADFIPLAEETGLIIPIGYWVLSEAIKKAQYWQNETGQELIVAVNISPRQFRQADFAARVEQLLIASGIDPSLIELEITEGVMIEDAESAIRLLHRFRNMGLRLSIDDFGTGYSSLAYLKRFPITKLKIDQSFVRHLNAETEDSAIVQAVISLGHSLGLTVIAEGVETLAQRERLRSWRCDEIQGFLYARPLEEKNVIPFIQAQLARGGVDAVIAALAAAPSPAHRPNRHREP